MTTMRTTVVFDYDVPDGTDPDHFHDELRDLLEDGQTEWDDSAHDDWRLETVREIDVTELDDES